MTKKAKREHLQKLTALFEQYDSLNMRQIQTELQTSPHNAQAALDELGAVKQGAKWVLADDEPALVEVALGAKAEIEPSGNSVELVEPKPTCEQTCTAHICSVDQKCFLDKAEPLSNPYELPESNTVKVVHAEPDWANAPLGTTHYSLVTGSWLQDVGNAVQVYFGGFGWIFVKDATSHDLDNSVMVLKNPNVRTPTVIPVDQPKQLDQSVFVGLPPEYRWAAVDSDGRAYAHECEPRGTTTLCWLRRRGYATCLIGEGYDTTNWWGNPIERETVNPVSEQKQDDAACPIPCVDQPVKAPSDYSPVFNNILGRVLQIIKTYGGATADRVHELTGMHPDDIADAVQYMVDHGQLVGSPLYFTTVYEVAA